MQVFNSFQYVYDANSGVPSAQSTMSVFNMPHIPFDGGTIDFRIERYDQLDRKSEGEWVNAPIITTTPERKRLYPLLGGQQNPFHGVVPSNNGLLSAYAGKVLYFIPNKDKPQDERETAKPRDEKVAVGSINDVHPKSERLPPGWHSKVFTY
jgi:hypothetical protein